jgi:tetratricopeptide (TPR) repeat protein
MRIVGCGWVNGRVLVAAAMLMVATLCGSVGGCAASKPRPGSPDDYVALYATKQYEPALAKASAAAQHGSRMEQDQAALIAGQSAHALGRPDEAQKWLNPLVSNADQGLSGRAGATLGLVAESKGQHAQAASLLSAASGKLGGDEGARAAMFAGDSYAAMGKKTEARDQYARALGMVQGDAPLRKMIADRQAGVGGSVVADGATTSGGLASGAGAYGVQLGAFATRAHADTQARKYRAKAVAAKLGSPQVVQDGTSTGLFAVRVGPFATRQAAEAARGMLGAGVVTGPPETARRN